MKKMISFFTLLLCSNLFMFAAHAKWQTDENSTLHVKVINHSSDTLYFKEVIDANPGNQFTVEPTTLQAGKTSTITVEKTLLNDIVGRVIFANNNNNEARLFIVVQEQIHFGQPIFNINAEKYQSKILSKTRNKNIGPRFLTYTEATVEIMPKLDR